MQISVILADIRSVHNVGSIFRTADAAEVEKIYLCGITPTPLDRFGKIRQDFAKVSLGAENAVPWEYIKSAVRSINRVKADGWTVIAVEQAKNAVIHRDLFRKLPKNSKICLIVGNEVDGVPAAILKRADHIVEIPMRGALVANADHPHRSGVGKESLNVGVSFGIAVFGLLNGR